MNRIIDYVFYRVYLEYEKYNYPAIFSSTCYISACILCLFLPLIVPLCNMMEDEKKNICDNVIPTIYGADFYFCINQILPV